ncbi:MAG: hypothetical protein AAF456_16960 [Planctomycetota bacterium]
MKNILLAAFGLVAVVGIAVALLMPGDAAPLYTNVLLGGEAETQVNFISRGRSVFVDENKDGIAQSSELAGTTTLERPLVLTSGDGTRTYIIHAKLMFGEDVISETFPQKFEVNVRVKPTAADIEHCAACMQAGYVVMGKSADDASTICFDGPVTAKLIAFDPAILERGHEFDLQVALTINQSCDNSWSAYCLGDATSKELFKDGEHPVLELTYQSPDAEQPVVETWPIDEFC